MMIELRMPPRPRSGGYTTLRQLADVPRAELVQLHGMGPKALRIIEDELRRHGLQLT
jgi:hypothetical protein